MRWIMLNHTYDVVCHTLAVILLFVGNRCSGCFLWLLRKPFFHLVCLYEYVFLLFVVPFQFTVEYRCILFTQRKKSERTEYILFGISWLVRYCGLLRIPIVQIEKSTYYYNWTAYWRNHLSQNRAMTFYCINQQLKQLIQIW